MDGDYLDTDLPHCSPSKAILPSPDDSSHALLSSIGYRGFAASDIAGGGFSMVGEREVGHAFDDSVLTDDLSIRLGDSPASSSGGGLLGGLIHAHAGGTRGEGGAGRRRSQASQRAGQMSPLVQPLLAGKTPHSNSCSSSSNTSTANSCGGDISGAGALLPGSTPLPPPPSNPALSTASTLPPPSSLVASTPAGKVPFSSPAVLAKAKQANISPSMARASCNCKKSKCLKLYVQMVCIWDNGPVRMIMLCRCDDLIVCLCCVVNRYCECFAALRYCDSCNCLDCNNCKEHEEVGQGVSCVFLSVYACVLDMFWYVCIFLCICISASVSMYITVTYMCLLSLSGYLDIWLGSCGKRPSMLPRSVTRQPSRAK